MSKADLIITPPAAGSEAARHLARLHKELAWCEANGVSDVMIHRIRSLVVVGDAAGCVLAGIGLGQVLYRMRSGDAELRDGLRTAGKKHADWRRKGASEEKADRAKALFRLESKKHPELTEAAKHKLVAERMTMEGVKITARTVKSYLSKG